MHLFTYHFVSHGTRTGNQVFFPPSHSLVVTNDHPGIAHVSADHAPCLVGNITPVFIGSIGETEGFLSHRGTQKWMVFSRENPF